MLAHNLGDCLAPNCPRQQCLHQGLPVAAVQPAFQLHFAQDSNLASTLACSCHTAMQSFQNGQPDSADEISDGIRGDESHHSNVEYNDDNNDNGCHDQYGQCLKEVAHALPSFIISNQTKLLRRMPNSMIMTVIISTI